MRRYSYKARESKTNKVVKGTILAENEKSAGKLLVEQGYIPDNIAEEGKDGLLSKIVNRVTSKDRIMFTRQFATLIGAGLPLANSLRTVADQTENKAMKSVIEDVLASVEAGKTLYDALSKYPKIFDNVYLSLVKAGETSGTLDEALVRLADQQEKDAAMLSKIRGAMVYPAIILVVIIAVLAFMMIEIVPQVQGLYEDLGEELPGMTKALVIVSDFFAHFWWLVILIIAGLVWGIMQYRLTPAGKRTFAGFKLHVPMFNDLFLRLYMNRFARTAQMLLATGVSMLDSITISAQATSNVIVEEQLMKAAEQVKGGKPLSEALKDKDYILPLVPQMASIGEQSGKIDDMLGRAAQVYENELDEKINNIATLVEPILMVVMAGIIGIVIGGTLLPIYSLVNSMG